LKNAKWLIPFNATTISILEIETMHSNENEIAFLNGCGHLILI
jgi:hypothetical protein